MSNLVYPGSLVGQTPNVIRSPQWTTVVQQALTGKSTTIARQFYPLMHFELEYELLRDDIEVSDLKALVGLFNAVQGRYDTFLFRDPDFNSFSSFFPQQFGVGDGATTVFQLTAFYGNVAGSGYSEIIQALNGAVVLYDNNGVVLNTAYSINAYGLVTYVAPPVAGHLLTWSGAFYYRCAFDHDKLDVTKFMNKWWSGAKIGITQVIV